ncbi:MAG: hypothetical protein K2Q18_16675, partial [Bdellovibrionales bacterium]|nr:hypothetical protein [Bdellovibrionales bacterium]
MKSGFITSVVFVTLFSHEVLGSGNASISTPELSANRSSTHGTVKRNSSSQSAEVEESNLALLKDARSSTFQMLVKASKLYKKGAMTKEKYIEIALQCAEMEDFVTAATTNTEAAGGNPTSVAAPQFANINVAGISEIAGAMETIKTPTGNSTVLTCLPNYITYTTSELG